MSIENKKTKFSDCFFCPAPWKSLYYHLGESSPCHLIMNDLNLSPDEYLKSDWLKNIKNEMLTEGVVPTACHVCKGKEDRSLKSTRGALWGWSNIGPEPVMDLSEFSIDTEYPIDRIELRSTNLCNFKCRMCYEHSSSEIARENRIFDTQITTAAIKKSPVRHINELTNLMLIGCKKICFTGGEPMLIKEYYDVMDFINDNGYTDKIDLELFTNCSIYNTKFIDKMLKFKTVEFVMSIDGVEKTAEYIRHGTNWSAVKRNISQFNTLPINVWINVAISPNVVLDVSSLAKFFMELYATNNKIAIKCYTAGLGDNINFTDLNYDLKKIALYEIDKAIKILTPINFDVFTTELKNIKKHLVRTYSQNNNAFADFTQNLDIKRQENFEDVFRYKLY